MASKAATVANKVATEADMAAVTAIKVYVFKIIDIKIYSRRLRRRIRRLRRSRLWRTSR